MLSVPFLFIIFHFLFLHTCILFRELTVRTMKKNNGNGKDTRLKYLVSFNRREYLFISYSFSFLLQLPGHYLSELGRNSRWSTALWPTLGDHRPCFCEELREKIVALMVALKRGTKGNQVNDHQLQLPFRWSVVEVDGQWLTFPFPFVHHQPLRGSIF